MINFLLGFILGLTMLIVVMLAEIRHNLDNLLKDKPAGIPPAVTGTNQAFVNENRPGSEESLIVEPKSPQLIDWEEQQELERLNKQVTIKPR